MKKFICALCATLCLMLSLATFTGCGSTSNKLKISFFKGGYGQAWGYQLAQKFTEETGIEVEVDPNPTLQSEVANKLKNGSDSDLIFSHGIYWEIPAANKQIEPLNDLYEMEVENGVKFKDRIVDGMLDDCKIGDTYYKVPWTNGAGGLVYNKKMFTDNGWAVPTVYSNTLNPTCDPIVGDVGLMELCDKIAKANIKVEPDNPRSKTVKPFSWSSATYYWDYVVFDWWAQLAGIDNITAYKKIANENVFDPDGMLKPLKDALKAWTDLVAKHPEYSIEGSSGTLYTAAQMNFVNGQAAMMPCAQWIESEMRDYLDAEVCDMAMMPTPFLADAKKDDNGNYIRVNYQVGGGDSIIIPSDSRHKSDAKKFLAFLAREENSKMFTEATLGVMLGFKYDNIDDIKKTGFMDTVFDVNSNSAKFNLYSQHPLIVSGKLSLQWPPAGKLLYSTIFEKPNTSIDAEFNTRYGHIKNSWKTWMAEVGVEA